MQADLYKYELVRNIFNDNKFGWDAGFKKIQKSSRNRREISRINLQLHRKRANKPI